MTDDQLRTITAPTLLLFGEQSPVNHSRRAADRSRRLLTDVAVEIIPGVGHMLPLEQPDLFTHRLLSFVDGVDVRLPPAVSPT